MSHGDLFSFWGSDIWYWIKNVTCYIFTWNMLILHFASQIYVEHIYVLISYICINIYIYVLISELDFNKGD